MENLKIDPEFQGKIPPLTEDEFNQLKENILSDGEVYEPIITWNGIIVDGHNRWRILCEHPEIPHRVKEMAFADKWEAFEWMYKKQLGRRNLTVEQRMVIIGKMYEARKKSVGNSTSERNDDGSFQCAQNEHIGKGPNRTAEEIAADLGIGRETVKRAEKFAKGVEALRSVSPEAAEKVLQGKADVTKTLIQTLAGKDEKEVRAVATAIENDARLKSKTFSKSGSHKSKNDDFVSLVSCDVDAVVEFTIEDLLEEMRAVNNDFLAKYRRFFKNHAQLISDNAAEVATVFTEIITEIEKMEEF